VVGNLQIHSLEPGLNSILASPFTRSVLLPVTWNLDGFECGETVTQ
jgi:hypothetical protein